MGLINLKTNLRSLSYGSGIGEPYIRRPLPAYNEDPGNPYLGTDAFGRQGSFTAASEDAVRLRMFFNDGTNPRSGLFPLKQKLLSLQGPQGPYAPIRGTFTSNNLILQAELNGTGTHINSRGAVPFGSKFSGYEYLTTTFYNGDANRLNILYTKKIANQSLSTEGKLAAAAFGINPGSGKLGKNILFTYPGGPKSPLTIISRASDTSQYIPGIGKYKNVFTLENQALYDKARSTSTGFGDSNGQVNNFVLNIANNSTPDATRVLGRLTNYTQFNRNKTFSTGEPGNDANLNRQTYYEGAPKQTEGTDLINYKKIYSSTDGVKTQTNSAEDLIKFYIAVIDNNNPQNKTYIHFRAYIDGLTDNYNANWASINYPGRGEEFFKYGGFTRDISFSFKVHVASRAELFPVYNKLNYLASIMAPDYSNPGFMRGNIVQLTVGDYINDTYGVITGFSFNIPEDSTWEIGRKDDGTKDKDNSAELPLLINVDSFSFKPIHNFLPRTVRNFDNPESRFISLGNALEGQGYGADKRGI